MPRPNRNNRVIPAKQLNKGAKQKQQQKKNMQQRNKNKPNQPKQLNQQIQQDAQSIQKDHKTTQDSIEIIVDTGVSIKNSNENASTSTNSSVNRELETAENLKIIKRLPSDKSLDSGKLDDDVSDIVSALSETVVEHHSSGNGSIINFYSNIYNANLNSIVNIISYLNGSPINGFGFFVSTPSTYIITACSCILHNHSRRNEIPDKIIARVYPDNRTHECQLIGIDTYYGVAVLKIIAIENKKEHLLIEDSITHIGERYVTFSRPNGKSNPYTTGFVTHNHFQYFSDLPESLLVSDKNFGDGQPVINKCGRVIGMSTSVRASSGEIEKLCVGSHVLTNTLNKIHNSYKSKTVTVRYDKLGIQYECVQFGDIIDTSMNEIVGVKVTTLHKKSILKSQIKQKDIITHINGIKVGNNDDNIPLSSVLHALKQNIFELTVRVGPSYEEQLLIRSEDLADNDTERMENYI